MRSALHSAALWAIVVIIGLVSWWALAPMIEGQQRSDAPMQQFPPPTPQRPTRSEVKKSAQTFPSAVADQGMVDNGVTATRCEEQKMKLVRCDGGKNNKCERDISAIQGICAAEKFVSEIVGSAKAANWVPSPPSERRLPFLPTNDCKFAKCARGRGPSSSLRLLRSAFNVTTASSTDSVFEPFLDDVPAALFDPSVYMNLPHASSDLASGVAYQEHGQHEAKGSDEELDRLAAFAQRRISESQVVGITDPAHYCTTRAKLLVLETPSHFGIGGSLSNLARGLGHAMLLGRQLVVWPDWIRWTGKTVSSCHSRGFGCFFVAPSACTMSHVKERIPEGKWPNAGGGEFGSILGTDKIFATAWSETRVIRRHHYRNKDLPTSLSPHLLPPGYTDGELSKLLGKRMTPNQWAHAQLLRYLMRAPQPWASEMIIDSMRCSGFPWRAPTMTTAQPHHAPLLLVIAAHHRNGEKQKDIEIAPRMGCGSVDISLGLQLCESLAVRLAQNELKQAASGDAAEWRFFFSYDHPGALDDANTYWSTSSQHRSLISRVKTAAFPRFNHSGKVRKDSRDTMKRAFGPEHVAKVSFVNLFLSSACDAWVNNDASNWGALINMVRFTMPGRRWAAPYVDIATIADDSRPEVSAMVREHFCSARLDPERKRSPRS